MINTLKSTYSKVRKQLSITPHTLGQLQMRRNGPRILLNSVPKSGTNLLQTCLSEFPNLLSLGHFYDDINVDALERYIKQLMPGQFATAHLEYSEHAEQLLAEESVKVVFIMRDPRDIAVSAVKYYLQINRNHMYGAYFHSLPDDETRLRVMLEGTPEMKDIHGHVLDFGQRMRMYMDWALVPAVYAVRFEELIGNRGGGSASRQAEVVGELANHIGYPLTDAQVQKIAGRTFSTKAGTFRKGQIGGWRAHFSAENQAICKQVMGQLLIDLGYETDLDW